MPKRSRSTAHSQACPPIAKENNIKKAPAILQQINTAVHQWKRYAQQAEVRPDLVKAIEGDLGVW